MAIFHKAYVFTRALIKGSLKISWKPLLTSFSNLTAWQSKGSKGTHAVNAIEGLGWKFDHSNPNKEEQIKGLAKCEFRLVFLKQGRVHMIKPKSNKF